jgi:hypothetical protein
MDGMNKWIERFKKCVAINGDYVGFDIFVNCNGVDTRWQ